MNRRLLSVLLFAVVVASVASFLVYQLLVVQLTRRPRYVSSNKLVVAAHDLKVGTLIRDLDLQLVPWDGQSPADAVRNTKDLVGRGVISTIYQNELMSEKRLAPRGAGAGLASTIPIGKRAVALKVNEVVGLAGFVVPGTHVDVIVSGNGPNNSSESSSGTLTKTVLQNLEVLSAGQHIEKTVDGKPEDVQVVNLLVNPDQAEILSLASSETKVQLVLRNPLDQDELPTAGTSTVKLFGIKPARPAATVAALPTVVYAASEPKKIAKIEPASPSIEIFNGTKRSDQSIDGNGGTK